MRKEGTRLIIEPALPKLLLALLATLDAAQRGFLARPGPASRSDRSLMRFLLDTNVVSDLIRHPQGKVVHHIREVGEARQFELESRPQNASLFTTYGIFLISPP